MISYELLSFHEKIYIPVYNHFPPEPFGEHPQVIGDATDGDDRMDEAGKGFIIVVHIMS